MSIVMEEDVSAMNDGPESFIGSMRGTMEIVGDIISPIDEEWEAEAE
jgi:hypothetical protein